MVQPEVILDVIPRLSYPKHLDGNLILSPPKLLMLNLPLNKGMVTLEKSFLFLFRG